MNPTLLLVSCKLEYVGYNLMILEKLVLQNFRNYSKKGFEFSEKTNLIVGPNAMGKTNILEAIYFLASGRSFRVKGVEREAIKYNEEIGRIIGEVGSASWRIEGDKGDGGVKLEIVLTAGEVLGEKTAKKRYFVNGVAKRQLDFLGNFRAVYFGPGDLELVTDSPSLRRKYLDMVLVQVDREYRRCIISYEKGLRQRNKLLEEMRETGTSDRRRLFFWDQLIIKNGNYITQKREEYIEYLNTFREIREISKACCSPSLAIREIRDFRIEYDPSTISAERLEKYKDEEIAAGVTLVGPHRDNFSVRIMGEEGGSREDKGEGGRDLSIYGSRGEQRLAILWIKLGELSYIEKETNTLPVLLLDDIFSELDVEHRKLIFDLIGRYQTIITTADIGMIKASLLSKVKILDLS